LTDSIGHFFDGSNPSFCWKGLEEKVVPVRGFISQINDQRMSGEGIGIDD